MNHATIGIIAHVDSGKTTLSESILHKTGVIKRPGRVDAGSSFLDTNDIERDRGITIFSSQAVFSRGGIEFTLLDTPGHVDFSPETERTLRVIDLAVLVISGTDGVQSHTETLWRLLGHYGIPTVLFVNKMDISALTNRELMDELNAHLSDGCVNMTARLTDEFAEEVAMTSEPLMDSFLAGEPFRNEDLQDAVAARRLFPCYFGSALKGEGVNMLLDGLAEFMKLPDYPDEFGAKVYKITQDKSDRLVHVKVTGGLLRVKDTISGKKPDGTEWTEKINQIRIYSGEKWKPVNEAPAGCICALTGIESAYPGEGLGFERDAGAAHLEPVLSYRVDLPEGTDVHVALTKLRKLEEEEPALHITYNERLGEIYFGIMGEVQLEVLSRIIAERFGMEVTFSDGSIAYRETIAAAVLGIGHFEPLRHYAEVQLLLEPLPRGSGLKFTCDLGENQLEVNWQRLILTHLYEKTHIGVLTGSPITDMKITLIAGRAHAKHTEGGDFRQATWRAVRQGLLSAESVLLEPWYDFRLELPTECVGRAMTDITQMGGRFESPDGDGETSVLSGSAPVSAMRSYHRELVGYTKGRGRLFTSARGYEPCADPAPVIEAIGYDAERDVENTGDSVFCAHGGGFVVKWDEVPAHAHIDSGVELGDDGEEQSVRVERYMKAVASNEELMAIFERTYGPIKRRRFNDEQKVKHAVPQRPIKRAPRAYMGKEYLLVDGYNIIFAWDDLRALSNKSLDLARESLITRLCNFQGFRQCEVIVVFDAYKVKGNTGELEKHGGLSVVYTKEAETADTYIEKVSHELSKTNRVRVATSDGQEQLIILGNGAIRLSASTLLAEVVDAERQIREFLD